MGVVFSDELTEDSQKFEMTQTGLQLDTAKDVAQGVAKLTAKKDTVREVDLSKNSYGKDACACIGGALSQVSDLQIVNFSDIFAGQGENIIISGLKSIAGGLMPCRSLAEVDFSDNSLGPGGVKALSSWIEASSQLKVLKVNNCALGIEGGGLLAETLLRCDGMKLTVFAAGDNNLLDQGTCQLARVLKSMESLRQISMPRNGINEEGMVALCEAFDANPNLQVIEIQGNSIDKEPIVAALAGSVRRLQFMSVLNIGYSDLKDEGACAVLGALAEVSPHLLELHMEANELRHRDTAAMLMSLLIHRPQLERVNLAGNDFDEETRQALADAFEEEEKPDALDDFESDDSEDEGRE